ncbi:MAG: hypothetical protein WCD02_18760 [Terriglobales bacterium]
MNSRTKNQTATDLIENTIDNLRIDSAFLRMRSRAQVSQQDAETLRQVAEKIARLTKGLQRLVKV